MLVSEAVQLLLTEKAAMERIIRLAIDAKKTAGGDAAETLDYIIRRQKVVTAMDMAIGSLNRESAHVEKA